MSKDEAMDLLLKMQSEDPEFSKELDEMER
jgi:hypothetical protein